MKRACWLSHVAVFLVCAAATGQEPPPNPDGALPPPLDETIQNDRPPFYVNVDVDRPSRDYREGDTLAVRVASEQDAYVYVLYQQADGKVYQVFPNKHQPDNLVKARQAVQIPASQDLFRWVVGAPFGTERVKVIASKEPIDILSHPDLRSKTFNSVARRQLKGVELELDEPDDYSESTVEIVTYARDEAHEPPGARRLGLFCGAGLPVEAAFKENASDEFATQRCYLGGARGLNLPHRDAQRLSRAMRLAGRLNETKVLTNEAATSENLQKAITEWLPSVSRPGDTIVIYLAGYGRRVPDLNGDESDGQEEVFVTRNFIDAQVLDLVCEKHQQGLLENKQLGDVMLENRRFVEENRQGADPQAFLALATAVTDDMLGHWLQSLSGRKVVVLFEAWQSQPPGSPAAGFDFLEGEVARLKSVGHGDVALVVTSSADTAPLAQHEPEMGPLAACLHRFLGQPGAGRLATYCDGLSPLLHEHAAALRERVTQALEDAQAGSDPASAAQAERLRILQQALAAPAEPVIVSGSPDLVLKP